MKDLTGKRFGKLVVVKHDDSSTTKHPRWICQCDCGSTKSIHASALISGLTRSCGCLRRETMDSKTRLHRIWRLMRHRALKHTSKSEYHFDRGITMCDEWANDFKTFKEWSLANGYDDNLSIDRIDNDKGYSPDNCRWTTAKVQANNRRNNVYITINNETLSLSLWCDKLGINRKTASAYNEVLSILDTMQEEHVSDLLNTESMIESYKQRLISQANGVKNSPFIDMCLVSYKHGINETLDTLKLSSVQRTVRNCKEPVSEDLEDFALQYAGHHAPYDDCMQEVEDAVKAGAQWQKEQMIANTSDAMIGLPYENKDGGYTHLIDVSRPLPVGNNKIAIIFKED